MGAADTGEQVEEDDGEDEVGEEEGGDKGEEDLMEEDEMMFEVTVMLFLEQLFDFSTLCSPVVCGNTWYRCVMSLVIIGVP